MDIKEVKDQIQSDLICLLEGEVDRRTIDIACQIVNLRFNSMEKKCYTEDDMRKAHYYGTKYTKGTIGEAQDFLIEKLLKS